MVRKRRPIYVSRKPVRLDPDYIVKAPMTDEELRQFLAMKKRQRLAFEAKCTRMHNGWLDAGRERNDRIHWYHEPIDRIAVEQEFRRCTCECGYEMSLSYYLEV